MANLQEISFKNSSDQLV